MFKIDADVPMPEPATSTRTSKYPWQLMDVNDSFLVPDGNVKSLKTTAYAAGKRYGAKFRAKEVEGGVRIWRVE